MLSSGSLQPWKHFVPVKEDFSSLEDFQVLLVEKLEWARANDDACRAMVRCSQ